MFCCLPSLAEEAFTLRERLFSAEVPCCLLGVFPLAAADLVGTLDLPVEVEGLAGDFLVDVVVLLAVCLAVRVPVGLLAVFGL